jgi:hypothetical protein
VICFPHVGGPTLLVQVAGWRLLTAPTFDPPGRRYAFGTLRLVQPRVAVPVRYEGWAHFRQGRADVDAALAGAPDVQQRVRWLPLGESTEL